MVKSLYSDARLYDLLYPQTEGPGSKAQFYLDLAAASGEPILELACGTGSLLLPIAAHGITCQGLDRSGDMLARARAKLTAGALSAGLHRGDMTDFELDERFGLVFVGSNSLTHLLGADDLVACFRAARRHLAEDGRFAFDVFNPSVQLLASATGLRREGLRFTDPERGEVRVAIEERYDAAAQVTHVTWYFSTESDPDFLVSAEEVRSIFPQELLLLLDAGGLRLVDRFGDFARAPFTSDSPTQVCICEAV